MNSLDPQHPQKELVLNKHDGGISKPGSLWKGHCPRILSLFCLPGGVILTSSELCYGLIYCTSKIHVLQA